MALISQSRACLKSTEPRGQVFFRNRRTAAFKKILGSRPCVKSTCHHLISTHTRTFIALTYVTTRGVSRLVSHGALVAHVPAHEGNHRVVIQEAPDAKSGGGFKPRGRVPSSNHARVYLLCHPITHARGYLLASVEAHDGGLEGYTCC